MEITFIVAVLLSLLSNIQDSQCQSVLISKNKPAQQSTSYIYLDQPVPAGKANDGIYANMWFNDPKQICSHTDGTDVNPWWEVDLQGIFGITNVKIWNRLDCCADRLLPLKIETSLDKVNWNQCNTITGTGIGGKTYEVPCLSAGRYVRISLTSGQKQYLTLCEVEVWGFPTNGQCIGQLLSVNKPASQSTNYIYNNQPVAASKANDAMYNNMWYDNNDQICSHTDGSDVNPWWQVDLQNVAALTQVKIWNRRDCCAERLLPLKIETSLDNVNWNQCNTITGTGEAGKIYTVPCVSSARYVRISLTSGQKQFLTLCEVEVYGFAK